MRFISDISDKFVSLILFIVMLQGNRFGCRVSEEFTPLLFAIMIRQNETMRHLEKRVGRF